MSAGAAIVLVLAGLYWWLWQSGALDALGDEEALRNRIQQLGIWGPLGIIGFMAAGLGLVWSLVDEERLTWHDLMSKTFPTPVGIAVRRSY